MINITPGYTSRGIIYSTDIVNDIVQRVYIRVPEIHGIPSEYLSGDNSVNTPDDQLPIANVVLRNKDNDYSAGDLVSVTFPTGDLDDILVTGILCKYDTSNLSAFGSYISSIVSKFTSIFGTLSGNNQQESSSGSEFSASVNANFLDYFQFPIQNSCKISAEFGRYRSGAPHYGTDIAAASGTPIYAIADGVVVKAVDGYTYQNGYGTVHAKDGGSYGNHLIISHGTVNEHKIWSLYGHMLDVASLNGSKITADSIVKKGDLIGHLGSTGNSTGPHLHLEIRDGSNNSKSRKNARDYIKFP